MKGWIGNNTGETATNFVTRLQGLNDYIKTTIRVGSTIAYSANGLILRQKESETTTEIRGITESAAELLKGLESDTTTTAIYYKAVGDNGEYAVVGLLNGTRTTVTGGRANEAGGWRVTISSVTYSAGDADGWSTTRPSTATSVGIVVDYKQTSVRQFNLASASGIFKVLYENAATTTREFQFLTESEANAKVLAANTYNEGGCIVAKVTAAGQTAQAIVKNYTVKKAFARYVSVERGWTVVQEETVYSPAAYYYGSDTNKWINQSNNQPILAAPFIRVQIVENNLGSTLTWKLVEG